MEKKIFEMQKEYVEKLRERQAQLTKKFNAKGYVVAGYGADVYYCYVGKGRGFNGAALLPQGQRPHIFSTSEEAYSEAHNGTYRNGHGDVIELRVVDAGQYFRYIHCLIERCIRTIEELS